MLKNLLEKWLFLEIDLESFNRDVEVCAEEMFSLTVFELDPNCSEPSSYEPSSNLYRTKPGEGGTT
jgi:hypothetical protein